jgi:hypothetical protein
MALSGAYRDPFTPGNDAPAHPHRHHPLSLLQKRQDAKGRRHLMLQRSTPLSIYTATQRLASPQSSLSTLLRTLNRCHKKQMDQYVQIMRKHHPHAIASGRNSPFPHPYPLNYSINSFSMHHSKAQTLTSMQTKPALQNPYTSFTLHGARSG